MEPSENEEVYLDLDEELDQESSRISRIDEQDDLDEIYEEICDLFNELTEYINEQSLPLLTSPFALVRFRDLILSTLDLDLST